MYSMVDGGILAGISFPFRHETPCYALVGRSKDFLRFSGFLFDFSDLFTDLARKGMLGLLGASVELVRVRMVRKIAQRSC